MENQDGKIMTYLQNATLPPSLSHSLRDPQVFVSFRFPCFTAVLLGHG